MAAVMLTIHLFWQILSPNGGGAPTGELADAINRNLAAFESFKEEFAKAATDSFWFRLGMAYL